MILLLLSVHWIADFILQSEEIAKNKSKSNKHLIIHVCQYSIIMTLVSCMIAPEIIYALYFGAITFISHFITDYSTSRWTSKLYKEQKFYGFPAFFSVIGLDQLLHQAQIILCYYVLLES